MTETTIYRVEIHKYLSENGQEGFSVGVSRGENAPSKESDSYVPDESVLRDAMSLIVTALMNQVGLKSWEDGLAAGRAQLHE